MGSLKNQPTNFRSFSHFSGPSDFDPLTYKSSNFSLSEVEIQRTTEFVFIFDHGKKLGPWETYFTLIKAFLCTSIIYAPRAFINGGWLFTSFTITGSAALTYFTSLNLLKCAEKTGLKSYSDVGYVAYGDAGAFLSDLSLITSQCGFCCAFVFYLNSNTQQILLQAFDFHVSQSILTILYLILVIGLCLVRKIQIFTKFHLIGDIFILITVVMLIYYGIVNFSSESSKAKLEKPVYLINPVSWSDAVGFSVYLFEGVGCIIPVQEVTKDKKAYPGILGQCILTVLIAQLTFSWICVGSWGSQINTPIITDMLPAGWTSWFVKIIFGVMIIISYTLVLFPAHTTIEKHLYQDWPKSTKRQCCKNLNRTILCCVIALFTLSLGDKLTEFISIVGALSMTPQAFILPSLFHFKICAETPFQKARDLTIAIFGIFIMFYCTYKGIVNWNQV